MKLTPFGYFSRTIGLKGELVLKEDAAEISDNATVVFVEQQGDKVPYFIQSMRFRNDGVVFLLEDVDTVEKAKALTGKTVYADSKFIKVAKQHYLTGFLLIDHSVGEVGTISSVEETGAQTLLHIIAAGDKEVILPLADAFVEKVDKKKKVIHFKAPEGLIDMYLSG